MSIGLVIRFITKLYHFLLPIPFVGGLARRIAPFARSVLVPVETRKDILNTEALLALSRLQSRCQELEKRQEEQSLEIDRIKTKHEMIIDEFYVRLENNKM